MNNNRILHIGNIHKLLEGLLPIVNENRNGFIKKGNLINYAVNEETCLKAFVSSDNIFVFTKQCVCVLIFYSYYNRFSGKLIGNNPDIEVYYDSINHYIYISSTSKSSEVSLLYSDQSHNGDIILTSKIDVSSFNKLI